MIDVNIFELERWLIERKRALGIVGNDFLPRNDGARRTESKRHLLRAIAESAADRAAAGDEPPQPGQAALERSSATA